jgi:hypothetical protein
MRLTYSTFPHQAVVQFMADLVNKRDANTQLSKKKKKKGFWHRVISILWPFRSS